MRRRLLLYLKLEEYVKELRKTHSRPRANTPTDEDLRHGDAYLIATHAAIEWYVEELCRVGVYASLQKWVHRGLTTPALAGLQDAFYWSRASSLPKGGFEFVTGVDEIRKSVEWYIKRVDLNNGIRRSNLLAMLLPFGFKDADFDDLWLSAMDSYGRERGDMAHGRPRQSAPRGGGVVSTPGSPGHTITVWSPGALRNRNAAPPWTVDQQLTQLLPELRVWDERVRDQCR